METKDETFNGWTNKPTWLVKLWLDNDEYSCNTSKEYIEDLEGNKADEALKEWVENNMMADYTSFGLQADLVNWSLASV